ncbi:uncharacterized protein MAM_06712 [Metarhizium album ARSEF 1941]|uniref:Wings apart-like protein C-terminal domain-containing protein n=1 Tax=Metarhizium album (strain ARSEF 1941) TaxID=1081103 RepID=A0A0B2WR33_METAS|nr:uncharacterized protein MAM_06712 [Metarhizium album ARSEF 1941]KHN95435.1 hypothetical protein MAM_06712 [Metarhizium album ARSEF 1941]
MASRHAPSGPRGIGQHKIATYPNSDRKKPSTTRTTRDPDPDSSRSKLSHIYDYPSSPESKYQQIPKHQEASLKMPIMPPSKEVSTTLPIKTPRPPKNGLARKRDHAAAFPAQKNQKNKVYDEKSGGRDAADITVCPSPNPISNFTQQDAKQAWSSHNSSRDSTSARATPVKRTHTSTSRRPRLIDALAAQKQSLYVDDDDGEPEPVSGVEQTSDMRRGFHSQEADRSIRTPDRRGTTTPANRKVRFTYSQARRIVSESQTPELFDSPNRAQEHELDPLLAEPSVISSPRADDFAHDESDDENNTQPAIKSVHELRRAGANNRFADEMDDLIARIGLPGTGGASMRRNALCELVQKLQRKDFMTQFRDHASRDIVARDIGKEQDMICGFALVSYLLSFLTTGPAPNLLRQLAGDGVGRLLALLLRVDEDITAIASHRKMNMSRMSRLSVEGVKSILQSLPIWHNYEPVDLSPRTAALQLMALLSRCADAAFLDQILSDAQSDIISVATWASEEGSCSDVDYALTVFTLETQSSAGVAPRLNSDGAHPRRIAKLLSRALQQWPSGKPELDSAILKLAINTTNAEDEAAAFDDSQLSTKLARRVGHLFVNVRNAILVGKLEGETYDELLLVLGVMINIMEHCPPARRAVTDKTTDSLVKLWQDNKESVGEADSVDKSKLSVAVGYLSVLLGYMCLKAQTREHLESRVGAGAVQGLRTSIQQFASMYKAVDNKAHAMDILVQELRRVV